MEDKQPEYSGPEMSEAFIGMFYVAHHTAELLGWPESTFNECVARFYRIDTGKCIPPGQFQLCYYCPKYLSYLDERLENIKAIQEEHEKKVIERADELNKNFEDRENLTEEEAIAKIEMLDAKFQEYVRARRATEEASK